MSAGPGPRPAFSPDEVGPLGERATLVQLSTAFCAPCRATRAVLARLDGRDGVRVVEVDAETHLELARRVGLRSTPTTLLLGPDGHEVARFEGVPHLARLRDAVAALLP